MVTLHFHSYRAKLNFILLNKVTEDEIMQETFGSLTLKDDGMAWENNVHVYSVEREVKN